MACKKPTVPFSGTPEQEAELKAAIAELKNEPGALMPVMQKAQEIYGYLPIEVQTMISDEMGTPLEKVYGVSTFYAQFALQPKGKYKMWILRRPFPTEYPFRRKSWSVLRWEGSHRFPALSA